MGAYCDSRILTRSRIAHGDGHALSAPRSKRTGFTGFLYAGLMMTACGPKVLEFNVRMGDPETQPLMHRLDSDFAAVLMAGARGELGGVRLDWKPGPSVCVVLASGGYPGAYPTGNPITGIADAERAGCTVFHAGTQTGRAGPRDRRRPRAGRHRRRRRSCRGDCRGLRAA